MSLFDDLDLGAGDYDKEKDPGLSQFTSKPIQRQYQPFGGPQPQTQSSIAQPQYAPPEPQPQQQPQPYHNFNDYDLDAYEQAKNQHSQISQYARENKRSASHYGTLYDDFKKNEFTPYFESMGGFGDFETDEEYISAIDEMYKSDLKNSQQEDGFFGASDAKLASQENLKKYASWNQPNGMRDKFLRLKAERDRRKATAEQAEAMEYALFEQMTSIPISQREALDASLKSRTAKPRSKKATDEMLNQMQFEKPVVDMVTGEVTNLERTDPRKSVPSAVNMVTGQRTPAAGKQAKRLEAAMRGDMAGFMSRRQSVAKDRQLRDKGFMFSNGGQIDGRPIGMSRKDTDLLDLEEMKKAGMTEYKGQPIEQAIESLGGEERLKVAKVMQSVYAAKSNYEDVQLEYLKNSGGAKGDALREKMEAAREEVNKTIGLAAQFGLDNELFEQAETTGWLSAIGNAVKRGLLMSEMSNYTPDFLTNTLDADEMQRFIEIASEIEELPTSSTMKRVKSTKSDGPLDAIGNLLFDNPAAIPEMFVESMASFLPSAIKWMLPTAATGALAGSIIPGAGTAAGATLGARASWGAASFVLEASGMALEGMQELGIDWKNPKIFAAAWTNESIRNKIQKKMVQKGTPIAVADMLTGMMAGKVMAIANHTGNAMFKGGKLLNKTQFNKTAGAVPRFTKFQKTRNAAAELGADSLMGMSGEYLGQWASKEPGEDWDWDAIAAEGIVGVGPGVLSSALEMRSRSGNYFGNAPIEITGEQMTETGSMGTVTRAGYSAPYQTFNDAESMMGYLQTVEGVSPESLQFTQNWVERMYAANPEEMSKLKIAFSPRTPDANLKNRGTFEARDGHNIMYINEKEFAADPMGAFMHESGHFARIMVMSDEELRSTWGGLGEDSQLEAYTQYFTKKPDATFDSLDEKTQKKIRRAFDRTPDDVLAEEWFSYQWGRVLMGYTVDKNVAKPLKNFKDKVIHPILGEYAGTENLAGSKSEQGYILDQKILQFLGYENGMPTPKVPDEGGKPTNTTPQTREQTQTKLNAMPGTPQEKSKIAKAVNAMLGADILTESPSFYSNMNRAAAVAASKDIEDIEKKKEVQETPKGLGWKKEEPKAQTVKDTLVDVKPKKEGSDKTKKTKPKPQPEEADKGDTANTRLESRIKEIKDTIAELKTPNKVWDSSEKTGPRWVEQPRFENAEDQKKAIARLEKELKGLEAQLSRPEDPKVSYSPAIKPLPKDLGAAPRKPQESDGLFPPTKPNSKAAQKRIKRAEKKEAQKAEIRKKRDAIRKAKREETVAFTIDELTPKDYEKPIAHRKFNTPRRLQGSSTMRKRPGTAPPERRKVKPVPRKGSNLSQQEKDMLTSKRGQEIVKLEMMLPKTKKELDQIRELEKELQKNESKFDSVISLDKAIGAAIRELKEEGSPSITQIISKVLNLETLLKLSPISLVSEIEKAMNPTASRSKVPSTQDIEDMATEARERIEDVKELLNLRLAEIDREIASLETGLAPQPAAGWQKSTAPTPAKVFAGIGSRALPPSAQKEVAKLFNQKGQSKPSKVHSGSAKGSDYLFEMLAVKAGIAVEAHTFEGHRGTAGDPANFKTHSQEELNKADSALKKVNETLGRTFPAKDQHTNNLLRRNYYQVVDSDQVIAFAPLVDGLVQGGTAWAVQMGIDMGKEVHIFDTNTAQWFSWPQPAAQASQPAAPAVVKPKTAEQTFNEKEKKKGYKNQAIKLTHARNKSASPTESETYLAYPFYLTESLSDFNFALKKVRDLEYSDKTAWRVVETSTGVMLPINFDYPSRYGYRTREDAVKWTRSFVTKGLDNMSPSQALNAIRRGLSKEVNPPPPAAQGQGPKVRYLSGVKAVNEAEAKGEGVSTLRKAGEQHFGNPFSHLDNSRDTTKTGTRTEAVEKYKQWLAGTDFKNVKQERRKWVLDQIESGALDGKDLLYYTKQQPNHAEALAQFIASKGQGPNAGAQAEIAELQKNREWVKKFLDFIAPEEASVDWKDVPHNLITFRRYKLVKGKKVYSPDTLKPIPMTFGMLASMKKWQEGSGEYSNIEYRPKNVDKDKRTPQEYLWDYVNDEFDPPPVSDEDKAKIKKPFYGGLTENQYRIKLEAIKASAMFTKQQDIGKKPMGSARWEVENNVKQEKRRGYPSGFTTERGANLGAVIAERIRQKGLSGKVKSDGTKAYANFDLETLEPTITDVVALMMANGRTLELLGDPSDSMKDFDHMLFIIAREEMKSKLLGEKDKGGVPSDLENQFEYAEEDGDPFIKVQPGATLAKTLLGVLSTKARLKFEKDYLDYIVENTQLGFDVEMSKDGLRFESLSGENPQVALKKFGEYIDSIKEKGGVDVRGKLVPIPKKIQESLTESYELLRARVDNEKYLSDQLNGHTVEVIGGVSKPQSKTVSKFRVKPEDDYDFRRPLSRTSENIPAKGDHGAFTAGDMYKTFDVMTAFSKRRESPELVADMLMGTSTGFDKERTNVGNSETAPARPINMDRAEADLLSSTDISAVDLANWYLGAKAVTKKPKKNNRVDRISEVKRMADLQMTPSSKDNKQLPGGLGEGLLPYVFRDFITAMYEHLNIKDLDLKIKDAESDKTFDWTYTEGRMMMGGELVDFNMFTDKEGMMHPEVMEALTRPVVQAVLDAEGIDVYDQFDPNSENLLQRDTQKAESFDKDDSAEMQTEADDTDSGAQTSKVEVNPVEQESLNQFQNNKRQELGANPDPVNKNPVEKRITLSDLVKSNLKDKTPEEIKAFTDDSMTDSFKQAQLAENVKEFQETFTPKSSKSKNRTLNSDAGKPINDLTVIGKIIALVQKNKPVHEINRLAAQWDDDEVYFVNSIARKKSTYEEGANNADVAKKILSDLREERKSRGFPNESLGSIEKMDFNDRSIVGQAKVIDKILKNKDFLNDDADEVTLVDGFYDLAAEAEEAGSSIGDLIRKAKEIEKRGGYAEFTDAVKSKVKPRIEKAKAKGFGPMKVREVFNKENKYKYNPVELNSFIDEEFNTTPDRTLNSDAGKQEMPMSPLNVYRSADEDFGFEEDFRLETTVGQELKKLGIKIDKNGVPYTDNKVAIKKGFPMILYRGIRYNPKTKTTGRPAEGVFFTREFETAEAYANGYKMSGNYEADMKAMDSYRDEIKANGEKLIVFSYLYQSPGNSLTKKAGIAPKQKELTVGTMEGPEDYNAMLEFGEYTFGSGTGERSYVLKTSQLSGLDGLLAAHEINADSSINEDGSTPKLIPFNEIPQNGLNPRELDKFEREDSERNLRNRTLNSDATLTSDVNPNLAKANLLSRIAGDSELKKNFEEWLKDKKDSELAGSFMMSFVDQADPLKRVHRSLFDTLKESGLDIAKGPMRSLYNMLNVHGKWHQYFGKGYDTVEQARIKFIQPIKDAMLKYGIDQGTFGNYLLARAAPSRNQHLRDKVKRLQKEAEELTGTERQTALKDIEEIYLNKDGSVKHSGISDQAAYDQITELEKDQNFVNFANEALDPYYNMNKKSIDMLRKASMIRESVELDGVQEGISEYDRMVGAMSKIDLADSNSDFNFAGSKVKLSDPKYSYSPMQGFEGETEAFFDAERAWEELGKGQNSSGKGWDQPKSTFLNDGAFGRYDGTKGPNPDSVLANAINQFFDSAIRSHKNEVSRSFGEMFELMRSIAYPDREKPYEPDDPELRIAYGQMSKLPEEQKKKIKEEFDEIFEQDFQKTAEKNMYTLETTKDGLDNEIVAKRKKLNAEFKQDPLVFVYRVNGAPEFIKFKNTTKGTRMARSMKNLKYESLPSVLKYFNKITRFMAQMFTSMNPAFIIPNFFRDLGTAFIHLTEDDKKKLVKDVFKFKNLKWITSIGKAELLISQGKDPMKGRTRTEKLKGQTEAQYAQAILKRGDKIEMYAYAKRNGAKIGYVRHDTVPELIRKIKKETGKSEGATKRRLKYALSYVDAANTGVENSVRMSTFWAAIKNGYTPQESATMSRNITVDFNQKGELTQAFGSLYVFFGAAVNSTHRFMTTLNRRSPAERATLIGGIATASFLVATFNRLLDDDEDEAVPDYDTISSYKRDTNLIMPIPAGLPDFFNDKKDTGYFSIPLPLGYNLFWSMGQVVADTFANNYGDIRGGSGVMEGANRLLQSSMNAFNPVGGASIATIGTPTFVTPIIELWANKNFMGREIRYKDDQFGVPEPGHMQDPKSTPAHWNALSKGLNEFFGGSDVIKGSLSGGFGSKNPLMYDQDSDIKFDISGNQFKHVFYGYLGGPGQLLDTAFGGLFSAAQGKASVDNIGQVPIINRFVRGTTYGSHTRELYYNLRDTVKTAEKAVKDAKKISPRAYSLVNKDLRPLLSINSQLKAFEAQKNKFSRLKSKVESAKNLTEAQKLQRIADIEEKQLNMMVKVIKKAQSLGIS